MTINQRAKKIKMMIMDVDGVLTDGRIIYSNRGNDLKCFNVLDGLGLVLLKRAGIKLALISSRGSKTILRRSRDIGSVDIKQNAADKLKPFKQILKKYNLSGQEICFIGDDLPDLPVIRRVGLAVAVANACSEVKGAADYISKSPGGQGAVREVAEIILKAQNKWRRVVAKYLV